MAQQPTSSALRALGLEFKGLQEEPVEGFRVKLVNEDNLFEWEVAIFGPPDTLYEGGYFKVNKAGTGRGGTCESRCLESGVSTDPEPCGFARPRMAVRGFPVSGEKGILVVEPSPG
ncbi:ubiquitin-conjugating enzyme E2 R2 [Ixodes scapularis]